MMCGLFFGDFHLWLVGEFLFEVGFHLVPIVVWARHWLHCFGEGGFVLVEQEFHKDWRASLAEENPLHVGSHREHLVTLPLVGQRREVGSAVVHIVKPHQAHQWKHHALVAETEGCAVFAIQNRLVGSGDEVAQKVGLHVWHTVFGEWCGTSPEIPADIVILPNFQTVFLAEKVVKVHILKLVMALDRKIVV